MPEEILGPMYAAEVFLCVEPRSLLKQGDCYITESQPQAQICKPLASASPVARITGLYHCTCLNVSLC